MTARKYLILGLVAILAGSSLADPNDFVNPKYVLAAKDDPGTRDARSTIVRNGKNSVQKGPWTVTDTNVRAATGDPRDYLSWAPYHWPDCNWCGQTNDPPNKDAKKQRGQTEDEVGLEDSYGERANSHSFGPRYNNESTSLLSRLKRQTDYLDPFHVAPDSSLALGLLDMMGDIFDLFVGVEKKELGTMETPPPDVEPNFSDKIKALRFGIGQLATTMPVDGLSPASATLSSMETSVTTPGSTNPDEDSTGDLLVARGVSLSPSSTDPPFGLATPTNMAQTQTVVPPAPPARSTSSTRTPSNPAEFTLRAHKPTKGASCTTSPTKSMPPSATWTTCPYKPRDGRVNPDVRDINSAGYFGQMSQAALWTAVAGVVSGSTAHGKHAVTFIDTFFLDRRTKMNANVEYGQVVRGPPGTQSGSYMGILDMRGLVKVVNAVLVLRASKSPEWTQDRDTKMKAWASQYIRWVESSATGKKARSAANNHGSFYPNQVAALKILSGDIAGARVVLQSYFDNQFQDQIVASGEQPLEAVRTRPFHYRCFNLEAVITNAKLGDYIGMNFWDFKNKYGATIQTAANYLISLDPGRERLEEALPHVAAIAAAYGDPQRRYASYLKAGNKNYAKKPFWFYDQPGALSRRSRNKRDPQDETSLPALESQSSSPTTNSKDTYEDTQAAMVDQDHPPSIFANGQLVELEESFFVGWDDVREFYRRPETHLPGHLRRTYMQQDVTPPPMFQDGKTVELEDGLEVEWEDISSFYGPSTEPTSA